MSDLTRLETETLHSMLKYAKKYKTQNDVAELKAEIERRTVKPKQPTFRICDNCKAKIKKEIEVWFHGTIESDYCNAFGGKLTKKNDQWIVHYLLPDWSGCPLYKIKQTVENCKKFQPKPGILDFRTDCYMAILDKKKKEYPLARFEIVTNSFKSVLSPSDSLLAKVKAKTISWKEYRACYISEMMSSKAAQLRIKQLIRYALLGRTVFLVCYEKNAERCHRTILKEIMMKISEEYPDIKKSRCEKKW